VGRGGRGAFRALSRARRPSRHGDASCFARLSRGVARVASGHAIVQFRSPVDTRGSAGEWGVGGRGTGGMLAARRPRGERAALALSTEILHGGLRAGALRGGPRSREIYRPSLIIGMRNELHVVGGLTKCRDDGIVSVATLGAPFPRNNARRCRIIVVMRTFVLTRRAGRRAERRPEER